MGHGFVRIPLSFPPMLHWHFLSYHTVASWVAVGANGCTDSNSCASLDLLFSGCLVSTDGHGTPVCSMWSYETSAQRISLVRDQRSLHTIVDPVTQSVLFEKAICAIAWFL